MIGKHVFGGGGASATTYVDDVFSAWLYTGNGSTQTITNGIDLAGRGGMVWIKSRGAVRNHSIVDTVRGAAKELTSNSTSASSSGDTTVLNAFTSSGFTFGSASNVNTSAESYVSWTFRKAPKFFDVVTWTGNGSGNRTISHSLGQTPGFIITKLTSAAEAWWTHHRSVTSPNANWWRNYAALSGPGGYGDWGDDTGLYQSPDASNLYIGSFYNTNGNTYVAYLFAHDPAADGIVQCGSFTTDGSGNATVNLGWEPQYLLAKSSTSAQQWYVADTARGLGDNLNSTLLLPNVSNAETTGNYARINATGFSTAGGSFSASQTYIYLAIRRPNKPPTTGTQVYQAIARAGTGAAATITGVGFAPDLAIGRFRDGSDGTGPPAVSDRLRGIAVMTTDSTSAESSYAGGEPISAWQQNGVAVNAGSFGFFNRSGNNYINWFLKRAPGVFDVVCKTVESGSNVQVAHSLGVPPELIITKARNNASPNWLTYVASLGQSSYLNFNTANAAQTAANIWGTSAYTSSSYFFQETNLGTAGSTTYVAYLFATLAGISKVGSYTGNGGTQTINCGFTTGARFILIKRTSTGGGNWMIWDTVRGIVAANDPWVMVNFSNAETTTDDSIDPDTTGFVVNQVAATNINVTSATYIYLAMA